MKIIEKTEKFISFAKGLAKEAGKELLDNFQNPNMTKIVRSGHNPQTVIDLKVDSVIRRAIKHSFPGHAIKSEEVNDHPPFYWNYLPDYIWIVDPCDGTINYMSGIPFFSVSIALSYKLNILLGVVYDPIRDEMFSAEIGKGAKLNDSPIWIGKKSKLSEATFGIDIYPNLELIEKELVLLRALAGKVRVVRSFYSGALELSYLAAARIDIRIDDSYKPWDIAAGSLIAVEAGAKITDLRNRIWSLKSRSLLASNPELHRLVLQLLKKTDGK